MNQLGFIRKVLYALKKDYGGSIDIYQITNENVNQKTGVRIAQRTRISINKAILMPSMLSRKFSYDLAYLSANKNFTYGAQYDLNTRVVIVDAYDLPENFTVTEDDYAVIEAHRYSIKTAERMEHGYAYILTLKETVGSLPYQVIVEAIEDTLQLIQQVQNGP